MTTAVDLCCKAGGATSGYQRLGWRLLGVDKDPQPNYCGNAFVQADAMDALSTWDFSRVDLIHASPPCQRYVRSGMYDRNQYPDLLPDMRALLEQAREVYGCEWVIENVPGAPMRADFKLCGCMFGLDLKRERWFETSWGGFDLRPPCHHPEPPVGVYGHPRGGTPGETWGWGTFKDWQRAMQINWMTTDELAEAIPPAYTGWVGWQYVKHRNSIATW